MDLIVMSPKTRARLADFLSPAFRPRAIDRDAWEKLKTGGLEVLTRQEARTLVWLHPPAAAIIFGLTARDFDFPGEVEVENVPDRSLPDWFGDVVERAVRAAVRVLLPMRE